MNRTQAGSFLAEQLPSLFGFSLRRCASIQDAEDVSQEIALRAFQALTTRDSITDPVRYLWMTAHNVLVNHYRDRGRTVIAVPPEDIHPDAALLEAEETAQLRRAIAFLSHTQREIIIAYYFRGEKQQMIADRLHLPVGTVKWHLFEARKELKRNMENTRNTAYLQFDPIRFESFGVEGSLGSEGSPWQLFRLSLHQNIAYAAWQEPRTIPEIAAATGVSPVYAEDAVRCMTEQGYLSQHDDRYQCELLLTETTNQLNTLSDRMYREAAAMLAPALLRALKEADIWSVSELFTGQEQTGGMDRQHFALWALLPWCIANSMPEKEISFSDVATLRPDGAQNIIHASLAAPGTSRPPLHDLMQDCFSGPCWNARDGLTLWQLDTCWSERRIETIYQHEAHAVMLQLRRFLAGESLSAEECSMLIQKGLLAPRKSHEPADTMTLRAVWLRGTSVCRKLQESTAAVYTMYKSALDDLLHPYAEALLAKTPAHQRQLCRYTLQNTFQSGWFITHCLHALTEKSLLPLPTENDRAALHTIIITK